jgi:ankyrin repeat protein
MQYLISERGCDPMSRGQYGRTPLHHACNKGRLDVVKYLVEDVKVDSSCRDKDDATPLHIAALCGHLSVVKVLVEDYLCDPHAAAGGRLDIKCQRRGWRDSCRLAVPDQ